MELEVIIIIINIVFLQDGALPFKTFEHSRENVSFVIPGRGKRSVV